MVAIKWLVSLAVHIWSHFYNEAATCLTKFDFHLVCPQYSNDTLLITNNNTRSAMECSTLCSSDLKCRSLQYNPNNKECRTNAERLNMRNTSCSHRIRYGEIQKYNCHGIEPFVACVHYNDCIVANTSCLDGRCECSDGHPYDYRTNSCPAGCAKYGITLREVSYYIIGLNNDIFWNLEITECQARCFAATTFVCRFIEYDDGNIHSKCQLSEFNAITAPPDRIRYENGTYHREWERNCD